MIYKCPILINMYHLYQYKINAMYKFVTNNYVWTKILSLGNVVSV